MLSLICLIRWFKNSEDVSLGMAITAYVLDYILIIAVSVVAKLVFL